jgi:hypothetical protein
MRQMYFQKPVGVILKPVPFFISRRILVFQVIERTFSHLALAQLPFLLSLDGQRDAALTLLTTSSFIGLRPPRCPLDSLVNYSYRLLNSPDEIRQVLANQKPLLVVYRATSTSAEYPHETNLVVASTALNGATVRLTDNDHVEVGTDRAVWAYGSCHLFANGDLLDNGTLCESLAEEVMTVQFFEMLSKA